jgi:hypothetical protein
MPWRMMLINMACDKRGEARLFPHCPPPPHRDIVDACGVYGAGDRSPITALVPP